jgi:ASC-1-like (ASCH) protein
MKRFIKLYSKNIKHTPKTIKNFKTFLKAMELKKKGIEDVLTDDELRIMQEGLELFPKIFYQLWW